MQENNSEENIFVCSKCTILKQCKVCCKRMNQKKFKLLKKKKQHQKMPEPRMELRVMHDDYSAVHCTFPNAVRQKPEWYHIDQNRMMQHKNGGKKKYAWEFTKEPRYSWEEPFNPSHFRPFSNPVPTWVVSCYFQCHSLDDWEEGDLKNIITKKVVRLIRKKKDVNMKNKSSRVSKKLNFLTDVQTDIQMMVM